MDDNIQLKSKKISVVHKLTNINKLAQLYVLLTENTQDNWILDVDTIKEFINKELKEEIEAINETIVTIQEKNDNQDEVINALNNQLNNLEQAFNNIEIPEIPQDLLDSIQEDILQLRTDVDANTNLDNERYNALLSLMNNVLQNTSYDITYNTKNNYSLKINNQEKPASIKYGSYILKVTANKGYKINLLKINNTLIDNYNTNITIDQNINIVIDIQPLSYQLKFASNGEYTNCNVNKSYTSNIQMGESHTISANIINVNNGYKIKQVNFDNSTYCTYSIINNSIVITPTGEGFIGSNAIITINKIICEPQDFFILFDSSMTNDINENGFRDGINCKIYESLNNFPIRPNTLYSLNNIPKNINSSELYCCVKRSLVDINSIGTTYKWLNIDGTYYEFIYNGALSGTHTNITQDKITNFTQTYKNELLTSINVWWDNASYANKSFKFI